MNITYFIMKTLIILIILISLLYFSCVSRKKVYDQSSPVCQNDIIIQKDSVFFEELNYYMYVRTIEIR